MDSANALRGELAASIDRTLVREARQNELIIAWVRLAGCVGMCGIELWLAASESGLAPWMPVLGGVTLGMTAWAAAVVGALRSGWWHPALPVVLPAIDALYLAGREAAVPAVLGVEHFVATQELTTVMGLAALLVITGSFRLTWQAVGFSSGLGLALYLGFASITGMHPFFMALHLTLLASIALAALGLTRIVDRAVQGEVTRLTVSRLLPETVFEAADADPLALITEPRSLDATVVITDLRGFTKWAEHRPPLEVLGFLNTVQGALADVVLRHGGTVDKFMGDGMLAVFGAPKPLPDHADRAVAACRELLAVTERAGEVALGIGVHSGDVVVGCLGSGARLEFTVLGDTVNTASRLEAATKEAGRPVLISGATAARLRAGRVLPAGAVTVRGKDQAVEVYTLEG